MIRQISLYHLISDMSRTKSGITYHVLNAMLFCKTSCINTFAILVGRLDAVSPTYKFDVAKIKTP